MTQDANKLTATLAAIERHRDNRAKTFAVMRDHGTQALEILIRRELARMSQESPMQDAIARALDRAQEEDD